MAIRPESWSVCDRAGEALQRERDMLLDDLAAIESGVLGSSLTKAEKEMLYTRVEQMNRLLARGKGGHA